MRKKISYIVAASFAVAATAAFAADPCAMYYGKGYCTDYVNSRLGTHIRGDAKTWSPNVAWQNVQKGDAAIFKSIDHVAYVEDVVRNARGMPVQIKVSEMNYGHLRPGTNPSCIVTVNFGVVTTRVTSASSAQYYRRM